MLKFRDNYAIIMATFEDFILFVYISLLQALMTRRPF